MGKSPDLQADMVRVLGAAFAAVDAELAKPRTGWTYYDALNAATFAVDGLGEPFAGSALWRIFAGAAGKIIIAQKMQEDGDG